MREAKFRLRRVRSHDLYLPQKGPNPAEGFRHFGRNDPALWLATKRGEVRAKCGSHRRRVPHVSVLETWEFSNGVMNGFESLQGLKAQNQLASMSGLKPPYPKRGGCTNCVGAPNWQPRRGWLPPALRRFGEGQGTRQTSSHHGVWSIEPPMPDSGSTPRMPH